MTRYHAPSWCKQHHRPHIRHRKCCVTNRERRIVRELIRAAEIDRLRAERDQAEDVNQ